MTARPISAPAGRVRQLTRSVPFATIGELRSRLSRGWLRRLLCTVLARHVGRVRAVAVGTVVRDGFRPAPLLVCQHCGKAWIAAPERSAP